MCVFSVQAQVQQGTGGEAKSGSVYSMMGVGMPVNMGSSSAYGMGLPGVSYNEAFVPTLSNPALWGDTVYGMVTGGLSLTNYKSTDQENSNSNSLLGVNHIQLQLPIVRQKVGVSLSMRPYTQSSYRFIDSDTEIIGSGSKRDTLQIRTENKGNGGINAFELGVGWKINSKVSVGYAASLFIASIDNDYSTSFQRPDLEPISYTRQTSGYGFGNRAGFLLTLPDIFKDSDQLSIGSSVSLPVNLNTERIEISNSIIPNSLETIVIEEGDQLGKGSIELPMKWQGGVTYSRSDVFSISVEGLFENWSSYRSDYDNQADQLTNRYKIGLGMRYFPYMKETDSFFSNFKYRLGVSYDAGHIELSNRRIETLLFSFGLGILSPNRNTYSSIDIGFQYGIRGTTAGSLVKENFWGLRLSVNLAEFMFSRPKLR